jgi:hypothetical protein
VDRIFDGELHPCWSSLSDVRIIMTFMHVLMVESLCQMATRRISAFECLVPGPRGSQWLHPILSGIGGSRVRLMGSRTRVELGHEDGLNWVDGW